MGQQSEYAPSVSTDAGPEPDPPGLPGGDEWPAPPYGAPAGPPGADDTPSAGDRDPGPPPPGATGRPRRRSGRSIRRTVFLLSSLCMATALVVLALLPTDYLAVSPRAAEPVAPHLDIAGGPSFEPEGEILYLTVSVSSRTLRRAEWLRARFDDDVTLIHEDVYTGGQSRDEVREQGRVQIADSKLVAERVAFEHLGLPFTDLGRGALVQRVNETYDVARHLVPGDVITSIAGEPVELGEHIGTILQDYEPGDVVTVTWEREGETEPRSAPIELNSVTDADGGTRTVLGVTPVTFEYSLDLGDYEVTIDTGSVGGPSAGLAFTLTLIDELTPGELTGGQVVAVTGQINGDGSVSPVGGVKQKAIAADREGAVAMLVPSSEIAEAEEHAGDMPVYGADTLDEALDILGRIGGDVDGLQESAAALGE
jgi:PDZ domain-containing protein